MASDLNVVALTGRLTRDPELRSTQSGTSVAKIRLAYTTRMKKDGAWNDHSNYVDVTVWGNQADSCAQYLSKGRRIAVQGELRWREWEATDGSGKRQAMEVNANSVIFLDYREDGQSGGSRGEGSDDFGTPGTNPAQGSDFPAPETEDDIPFLFVDMYEVE